MGWIASNLVIAGFPAQSPHPNHPIKRAKIACSDRAQSHTNFCLFSLKGWPVAHPEGDQAPRAKPWHQGDSVVLSVQMVTKTTIKGWPKGDQGAHFDIRWRRLRRGWSGRFAHQKTQRHDPIPDALESSRGSTWLVLSSWHFPYRSTKTRCRVSVSVGSWRRSESRT